MSDYLSLDDVDYELSKKNKLFFAKDLASYQECGCLSCKYQCPKCDSYNWLDHGDMEDCTAPDIFGCQCWDCKHLFWTGDLEQIYDIFQQEFTECNGDLEKMILQNPNIWGHGIKRPPYQD